MRTFFVLLSILLPVCSGAQAFQPFFDLMRKSDLKGLETMMDPKIQYCFNEQLEVADKAVALKALRAFLDRNAPKSLQPVHKGNAKGDEAGFAIATMEAQNGRRFRIYLYGEPIGGNMRIKELRIDPL
ncbi:MAG: DUF4783 domain-containing protein [Saprospiraceae bacterium]|nr:DUF4783 domain-containing protein [Saprospiraceae bacterium]